EAGYRSILDRLVVCWSKPEQQIERLIARGLTTSQARQRVAAQMPVEEKRRAADDLIDCSGSAEDTEKQVETLVETLKRAATSAKSNIS
ncbi:MAG TPA: dephospho-CoA kinase, partial [Candidatus Acidoferrales bacterium]